MREHTNLMLKAVCPECDGIGKTFSENDCINCDGTGIVNQEDIAHFSSRFVFNSVTLFYLILYTLLIVF